MAIANYGEGNREYLQRLLDAYRAMPFEIRLVVLSNIPKDLGPDVEVRVGLPISDPWSLPFAHRPLFGDARDDFDLFIYSEDDTLIEAHNIEAYLQASDMLPDNEIAGFLRTETAPDGAVYYSTAHSFFHWRPGSVRQRAGELFAEFSNDHSAAYMLTRDQLRCSIESGGFLVQPHKGRYDMLVSAATDPYTQCGMSRVLWFDRLDDFTLPHLANKYVGRMGLEKSKMTRLIAALGETHRGDRPTDELLTTETRLPEARWSKHYYDTADGALLSLTPVEGSVLSYGCGWGALEKALTARGANVTAIALDSVIGALVEEAGIETFAGSHKRVMESMGERRFDAILAPDVLHLAPDPAQVLVDLRRVANANARLIVRSPNLDKASVRKDRLRSNSGVKSAGDFEHSGMHRSTRRWVDRMLRTGGWRPRAVRWGYGRRADRLASTLTGGVVAGLFADRMYIEATIA